MTRVLECHQYHRAAPHLSAIISHYVLMLRCTCAGAQLSDISDFDSPYYCASIRSVCRQLLISWLQHRIATISRNQMPTLRHRHIRVISRSAAHEPPQIAPAGCSERHRTPFLAQFLALAVKRSGIFVSFTSRALQTQSNENVSSTSAVRSGGVRRRRQVSRV